MLNLIRSNWPFEWHPAVIWTPEPDYTEYRAEPDPRVCAHGPLQAWRLPNDIGFAVGKLSFHALRESWDAV